MRFDSASQYGLIGDIGKGVRCGVYGRGRVIRVAVLYPVARYGGRYQLTTGSLQETFLM